MERVFPRDGAAYSDELPDGLPCVLVLAALAFLVLGLGSGSGGSFPFNASSNSLSLRMVTPSDFAFSYFDPGSLPTTTYPVFLLTEFTTLPPCVAPSAPASSRERFTRPPVNTNVFPASREDCSAARSCRGFTPAARSR